MKKILTVLLFSTVLLTLTACGEKARDDKSLALTSLMTLGGTEATQTADSIAVFGDVKDFEDGYDTDTVNISEFSYSPSNTIFGQTSSVSDSNEVDTDETTELEMTFAYNGGVPIYEENTDGISLVNEVNTSDEALKLAYISSNVDLYVSFISYTTNYVYSGDSSKNYSVDHYIGSPYVYGSNYFIEVKGFDVEFKDNYFEFDITHEKLVAQVSDDYSTQVSINSLDIIAVSSNSIALDGFEKSTSVKRSITETIVNSTRTQEINLLNGDNNFTNKSELATHDASVDDEGDFIEFVGGISLRANDKGVFEYIQTPKTLQEANNMFSFIKWDPSTRTLSYDASHLELYYDRFLLYYDDVRDKLNNMDLEESLLSINIDSDGNLLTNNSYQTGVTHSLSLHQGEITIIVDNTTVASFEYYLDYSESGKFTLELDYINEIPGEYIKDNSYQGNVVYGDSFSYVFSEDINMDDVYIKQTGLEIYNTNIMNIYYSNTEEFVLDSNGNYISKAEAISGIAIAFYSDTKLFFHYSNNLINYISYTEFNQEISNEANFENNLEELSAFCSQFIIAYDYKGDFLDDFRYSGYHTNLHLGTGLYESVKKILETYFSLELE